MRVLQQDDRYIPGNYWTFVYPKEHRRSHYVVSGTSEVTWYISRDPFHKVFDIFDDALDYANTVWDAE